MGRPDKLSAREWEEIGRRYSMGESARKLEKEYPVTETAIRKRFSSQRELLKDTAMALANAELRVTALPVSSQGIVRTLADQLKGMQNDYISGASLGLNTASKLQALANMKVQELDPDCDPEELKRVVGFSDAANKAAAMGSTLLTAHRDSLKEQTAKDTLASLIERTRGPR